MPLYLAPYIGNGTRAAPFRPRGSDQLGWSAIDLRHNAAVVTGYALLWLPVADPDPALRQLAGGKLETLTAQTRNALDTALNIRMTAVSDPYKLIQELLLKDWSDRICKPVQWSWKGEREVWLAGERWVRQMGGPTNPTTIDPSDDFNRADENPIVGNWTLSIGSNHNFQLISNELGGVGTAGDAYLFWAADAPPNDQWSEIRAGTALGTGSDWGPACRVATDDKEGYFASCFATGEELAKHVAASYSSIAVVTTSNIVAGDVVRVEAEGSTIRFKVNGVEVTGSPGTDTSLSSGRWGVFMFAVDPRLDDWRGGDFAAEPAYQVYPFVIPQQVG